MSVTGLPFGRARECVHTEMRETPIQSHLGRRGQSATRNLHSVTPEGPQLWKEDMQLCIQIAAGSHSPAHLTQGYRNAGA